MLKIVSAEEAGIEVVPVEVGDADRHFAGGPHSEYEEGVFAGLVKGHAPEVIYEFGTYYGERTRLMRRLCPGALITTIDKEPQTDFGLDENIRLIPQDSRLWRPAPVEYGTADLVFIDGDHHMQGVASDTRMAMSLAMEGCLLIWHDCFVPTHQVETWRNINHYLAHGQDVALFLSQEFGREVTVVRGTTLAYMTV